MINLVKQMDLDMVNEVFDEYKKSQYWLEKSVKKNPMLTAKKHMSMMSKTVSDRSFNVSDPVEYTPSSGNKWLTFFVTRYVEESKRYVTSQMSLCYIETVGSMGVVFPFNISSDTTEYHFGLSNPRNIFRFNSHFFFQMSERLGIDIKSKDMIDKFLKLSNSFKFNVRDEETDGKYAIDIIWKDEYIGRGYAFVDEDNNYIVYDIRTFLKIKQLSYAQRKFIGNIIDKDKLPSISKTEGEAYKRFFSGSNEQFSYAEETMLYNAIMNEFMVAGATFGLKYRPYKDNYDLLRAKLTSKYKIMFRKKERDIYKYFLLFTKMMNMDLSEITENDVNCFHLKYMLDENYNLSNKEIDELCKQKSLDRLISTSKKNLGLSKEETLKALAKYEKEQENEPKSVAV